MNDVKKRLKGVSCLLLVLSHQTDTSHFLYQEEALEILSDVVKTCVQDLEKGEEKN